jgi:hypothetical protein
VRTDVESGLVSVELIIILGEIDVIEVAIDEIEMIKEDQVEIDKIETTGMTEMIEGEIVVTVEDAVTDILN